MTAADVTRAVAPPPGAHGGDGARLAAALGVDRDDVLDLSASLNPCAPDVAALATRRLTTLRHYPDATDAAAALADAIGVDRHRLVLTAGGSEAIALVAHELVDGYVAGPEFSLYERHLPVLDPGAGRWRSNPNNPTGALAAPGEDAAVWDEAFWPLATGTWTRGDARATGSGTGMGTGSGDHPGMGVGTDLVRGANGSPADPGADGMGPDQAGPGLSTVRGARGSPADSGADGMGTGNCDGSIVVGSLTKVFACPGLRVGYVLTPTAELAERLRRRQPLWSVSSLACALVPDLLDRADLPAWRSAIAKLRAELADILRAAGYEVVAAAAPWVLVSPAGALRHRLANRGILVRDCSSFGLVDTVRIAVPDTAGLERVAAALR